MRAARGTAIGLGVLALHGLLTAWLWQRGPRPALPGVPPQPLVWVAAPAAQLAPPRPAAADTAALPQRPVRPVRLAPRAAPNASSAAAAPAAVEPAAPSAPAVAEAPPTSADALPAGAMLLDDRTLRRAIRSVPQHAAHSVLGSTAPSVQQRLERGVAESAVADCRTAAQGLGLLGAPLLVGMALTEKCRW